MTWRERGAPPTPQPPKRTRAPRFEWCKVPNGFPDYPVLRAAALIARAPVHQVVSVALRLECLANASEPRGSVADMSVPEFAASLQLRPDAVARIRAALEDPDIFWIDQDFITGFQARNPESDDHTAAERQRRHRAKLKAEREAHGIAAARPPPVHSHVTSRRDIVTSHAREEQIKDPLHLEDARARGEGVAAQRADQGTDRLDRPSEATIGLDAVPMQSADNGDNPVAALSQLWLAATGRDLVAARMAEGGEPAERRIAGWLRRARGDARGLREVIERAAETHYVGERFHNLVVDGLRRLPLKEQPELSLLPPRPGRRDQGTG